MSAQTLECFSFGPSVLKKEWHLRPCDARLVKGMIQQHQCSEIIARLLVMRGVEMDHVSSYLSPSLRHFLPDPFHLLDMRVASERLATAVMQKEKLVVFGDYDVDGATSTALLKRFLQLLGHDIDVYIPDRLQEGYGPNIPAFQALFSQGHRLLITVDCGTLAFEPLAYAKSIGMEVIVIDHHLADPQLPHALAIVNPNRLDETSPLGYLAAVGVTFLLAVAVTNILRKRGYFQHHSEPNLLQLLDLVALGTICDVVPLTGLNRAYVAQGLKILKQKSNIGLAALAEIAGLNEVENSYHLGFVLGPRINAGGRVGKASLGSQLLGTDNYQHALSLAKELHLFNEERKAIEMIALEQAMEQALQLPSHMPLIWVAHEGWHPGVIGIIAGRLKERFQKPTAVIALDKGIGKASARSISGVDFGAAVINAKNKGLLVAGGGHAMAAGFTITEHQLETAKEYFISQFQESFSNLTDQHIQWCDGILSPQGITLSLASQLEQVGPYGAGNPHPRFIITHAYIFRADIVGGNHVRCMIASSLGDRARAVKATAFQAASTEVGQLLLHSRGQTCHLLGYLKVNRWQGRDSAEFIIEDICHALP